MTRFLNVKINNMKKEIIIGIVTIIISAFFANAYLNSNASNECRKAAKICEKKGGALSQYKYESGYFGNCYCKIECAKEETK
jgi:hypothetical protein